MLTSGGDESTTNERLVRAVGAIQAISDYAQARRLDLADELLTELLAKLYSRMDVVSRWSLPSPEDRTVNVLRLLAEPDVRARSAPSLDWAPAAAGSTLIPDADLMSPPE
ncbi:hypothetical protein [Muricoccus radiodurans]|uniref:hypothetical protein n=1 Tax=Muricoccus radiodurans TaxID=2231721 RepID=UPI003CFAE762